VVLNVRWRVLCNTLCYPELESELQAWGSALNHTMIVGSSSLLFTVEDRDCCHSPSHLSPHTARCFQVVGPNVRRHPNRFLRSGRQDDDTMLRLHGWRLGPSLDHRANQETLTAQIRKPSHCRNYSRFASIYAFSTGSGNERGDAMQSRQCLLTPISHTLMENLPFQHMLKRGSLC
jgi:hypothetical protein